MCPHIHDPKQEAIKDLVEQKLAIDIFKSAVRFSKIKHTKGQVLKFLHFEKLSEIRLSLGISLSSSSRIGELNDRVSTNASRLGKT